MFDYCNSQLTVAERFQAVLFLCHEQAFIYSGGNVPLLEMFPGEGANRDSTYNHYHSPAPHAIPR